jgi:hypothetical protein
MEQPPIPSSSDKTMGPEPVQRAASVADVAARLMSRVGRRVTFEFPEASRKAASAIESW